MSNPVCKPRVSVIIPCYNPRRDYLERVLVALAAQTLSMDAWELVLVDNASEPPLADGVDLAWHPHGRVAREDTPGLTPARLKGFSETSGDLIVMVDDDNVLSPDYLERALAHALGFPALGVYGGAIEPEFDVPPAEWTRDHWSCLAIRSCSKAVWSNDLNHWESTPSGAGMCLRRAVAERYAEILHTNPLRAALDRCGQNLVSGGDTDIAWTACSMGLGMGRFPDLKLIHLIPAVRLTPEYLCRLYEGLGYSTMLLNRIWRRADHNRDYEGFFNLLRAGSRRFFLNLRNRRFLKYKAQGEARAEKVLYSQVEGAASAAVESV